MSNDDSTRRVPIGMVLDYSLRDDDKQLRVRAKGFRREGWKDSGLVVLVPVEGDTHDEDRVPKELRDLSVADFWKFVDEGQLEVIDSPEE